MAKVSNQKREIVKIAIFLSVIGLLLTSFLIYPLLKSEVVFARPDIDSYHPDSLRINSPDLFLEKGMAADTFSLEPEGLINLAALYISPTDSSNYDSIKGSIILLHKNRSDRSQFLDQAQKFSTAGFAVILYDQRASGLSSGKYRGDGQQEATDLIEILRYLDFRGKLFHPVTVIGFELGADAAILASHERKIENIFAINPYLTSSRMLKIQKEQFDLCWIPFYEAVMWYWYQTSSSYETTYRTNQDLKLPNSLSIIFIDSVYMDDPAIAECKKMSKGKLVDIAPYPDSDSILWNGIYTFLEVQ